MGALDVVYEDNHCLAVAKPSRLLTVGDRTGDTSLFDLAKEYLKQKYQKPGNVFLGLVHRLDRPVSGVVLFARTSKAAARLSEQFRSSVVTKVYSAVVEGHGTESSGLLDDWLVKDSSTNIVKCVPPGSPGARRSQLTYRTLRAVGRRTLIEIEPLTGRSHQIRVQLAAHGHPIMGDKKYGSPTPMGGVIALHALSLAFDHPVRHDRITVTVPPPDLWRDL